MFASSEVPRRSRPSIEVARYWVMWPDITLKVVKLAPSMVAITALLLNCATTEPSPELLVGIVLTTT